MWKQFLYELREGVEAARLVLGWTFVAAIGLVALFGVFLLVLSIFIYHGFLYGTISAVGAIVSLLVLEAVIRTGWKRWKGEL